MKLNSHQQKYYNHFKHVRQMYPKRMHYMNLPYKKYPPHYCISPSKLTKRILQSMNTNIVFMEGHSSKNNISPHKQCPNSMDVIIDVHGIECLLTFSSHKPYSLYIGYNKEDPSPYVNEHIIPMNLWDSQPGLHFFSPNKEHKELSNVLTSTIQDREYSEEELFQLSTIIPNVHSYINAYKRFVHIQKELQDSELKQFSLMKVLQIINEKVQYYENV